MHSMKQLKRLRWVVRAVLALGVAASVAANILHALPNPISRAIAAWPPLALLLTIELVSRIPVTRWYLATCRITATASIAGIAGFVSYFHMASVASRYGEASNSYLIPFTVDGLIVVASVSLVELAAKIRSVEAPATQPVLVQAASVVEADAAKSPVPTSPAAVGGSAPTGRRIQRPVVVGRSGPQVEGPSLKGLNGTPLMEAPPKV